MASKTSSILEETYATLNPLLFPSSHTFPYPLIESFAATHDPLTEVYGQKLFTASMALREAGVQVERATTARSMAKLPEEQATSSDSNSNIDNKQEQSEVKKSRLRAKLQSVNQPLICITFFIYFFCFAFIFSPPCPSFIIVKKYSTKISPLQQSNPQSSPSVPSSPEAVLRAAQQRREEFDAEMAREESLALEEFKRGLREVVLFAPGI